jgi:hypothetical protein
MSFWGKLLGKDSLDDLQDVLINLELLAESETQISEFYGLCAGAMENETDLWNSLANAEMQHADCVWRMMERIRNEPNLYRPGISFSTVTIRMFALEMQRLAEEVNGGKKSPEEIFAMALEIEDSLAEIGYEGIVQTQDAVLKSLAHRLDSESVEHKAAIAAKMNVMRHQ